jgi:hypothetical protein
MPENAEPANKTEEPANAHPSGDATASPFPGWDGKPVYPGSSLDWSSPTVPIQLYVELPFWLMMPEDPFDVKHRDTTLKICVAHDCEEIQTTTTHLKNCSSTVFIVRPGEIPPLATQDRINKSKNGCSAHVQRTTLIFDTAALKNALQAIVHEKMLNNQHGAMYLTALAAGQKVGGDVQKVPEGALVLRVCPPP